MNILALEASTTSAKAMLYHTDSHTYDVISREWEDMPSASMQDAELVYAQLMALGRTLAEGKEIDIISLSGTWHSVMICDAHMRPLTPAYLWNYAGASDTCAALRNDPDYVSSFYSRTGCMVNAIYPAFKLKHLFGQTPSLRTGRIMSLGSYLIFLMTGELVSTKCLASGSGLFNIHTLEYDPQVIEELGISAKNLSPLTEYNVTFSLNHDAASLLGLKEGIPVVPASSDGGLNQVGSGALKSGIATLSMGTSGAIRISSPAPVLPASMGTWCYRSPKGWLSGAATNGCCNCTDWAKNNLFPGGTSYSEIENAASDDTDTPVFLPFLFGERCPGWNDSRAGGFCGLKPSHSAADMYMAVQEGVLFNLYHCFSLLTDEAGLPEKIMLSGGVLNSKKWTQMCADIFNFPMTVSNAIQESLTGACVIAMDIMKEIPSAEDFSAKEINVIRPDEESAARYREKFRRYLDYYNA